MLQFFLLMTLLSHQVLDQQGKRLLSLTHSWVLPRLSTGCKGHKGRLIRIGRCLRHRSRSIRE